MTPSPLQRASQATGYSVEILLSHDRHRRVCWVRFAIMEQMRGRGLSLAQIGRALHRHHTTVLGGLRQAETLRGIPSFEKIRSAIA